MRILLMTPAYPPFPGGGERYVRSLALGLLAQGHEITAVTSTARSEQDFWAGTPNVKPSQAMEDGVQVLRCPLRPFPGGRQGLMAWRKAMVLLSMLPGGQTAVLQKMAARIPGLMYLEETLAQLPPNFDVVHGFNISWEYPLLAGWQWARTQQISFAATPFAHFGMGDDKVARNSTMAHQLQLLRAANRVLVLTPIERDELVARGIQQQRLDVIYGGLDPVPTLPDTAVIADKYKLPRPFVIFVGRASSDKGAVHAAQAVLSLLQNGVVVTLALVGQAAPEFERFYKQLSVDEQNWIRPLGIVTDEEKHSLIAESELLLLPSRTDSFGIVLLEAWAHGKPVIAARAGGIPGVVDEGENGLLVPFGAVAELAESLKELLADKAAQQRLGANGREKTKTIFTWQSVTERVVQNYETIMMTANR